MEASQKKQNIRSLIIFVITFLAAFFVTKFIFSPSVDKKLSNAEAEINKTCPIQVDKFTRLDNVVALPGETFQYNYTLVKNTKDEVNVDTVKKYIVPALLSNVRTNPKMEEFRENDVTLNYSYRDKNGVLVFKYTITPKMYQ